MDELLVEIAKRLENEYLDKYVDEEFLRWIFNEVTRIQDTFEYVCNGFLFGGETLNPLTVGGYDRVNKKIHFFDDALSMTKYEVRDYMNIPENSNDKIIAINILLINTLLHELEHVNQVKKKKDGTLEGYLLRVEEGRRETIDSYDYIPGERFAENIAIRQSLTILDNMGIIVPEINIYLEELRNLSIIKGYIDQYNQCQTYPIKAYMDKHNIDFPGVSLEEVIEVYPELEDRLFYGFPISEDEYFQVREKAGLKNTSNNYSLW